MRNNFRWCGTHFWRFWKASWNLKVILEVNSGQEVKSYQVNDITWYISEDVIRKFQFSRLDSIKKWILTFVTWFTIIPATYGATFTFKWWSTSEQRIAKKIIIIICYVIIIKYLRNDSKAPHITFLIVFDTLIIHSTESTNNFRCYELGRSYRWAHTRKNNYVMIM